MAVTSIKRLFDTLQLQDVESERERVSSSRRCEWGKEMRKMKWKKRGKVEEVPSTSWIRFLGGKNLLVDLFVRRSVILSTHLWQYFERNLILWWKKLLINTFQIDFRSSFYWQSKQLITIDVGTNEGRLNGKLLPKSWQMVTVCKWRQNTEKNKESSQTLVVSWSLPKYTPIASLWRRWDEVI